MAPLPDEIESPLAVVDALFAQHISANGQPNASWGEREHFQSSLGLQDEENFAKIPCLNEVELAESVPPFSLVRYRCLVQDVFEPELYATLLEEVDGSGNDRRVVTTKYRECLGPSAPGRYLKEMGHDSLGQRGAYYCVPLPGETKWAQAVASEWTRAGGGAVPTPVTPKSGFSKRSHPDEDEEMICTPYEPRRIRPAPRVQESFPLDSNQMQTEASTVTLGPQSQYLGLRSADEFGLNLPLSSEEKRGHGASTTCIVKVYDEDAEALHLCETVEIVGVLCVNPEVANFDNTPLAEAGLGRDARQPSTALVPRLHAIMVRRLPFYHPMLPFSPPWLSEARLAVVWQQQMAAPQARESARQAAMQQLLPQLAGDVLVAEYMLLLLVSRAFAQHGGKSLGSWALNIASWPEGTNASGLAAAAADIVPRMAYFNVNANTLNSQRWRPRKDFVANRLVAGQLQLAAGTLAIFDETGMAEGQLTAEGTKAIAAIKNLVSDQALQCDFMAYDVKVPLEVCSVLISQRKSIIRSADVVEVPLRGNACAAQGAACHQPGALDAARMLHGLLTRSPHSLRIPDEVATLVAEDFASARQEYDVSPDLCHVWMSLARARCLLHGEDQLTAEHWRAVMALEQERLRRCAA